MNSQIGKLQLTQNQYAIVDNEDYEKLNKWKWFAHNQGRKRGKSNWRACRMGGTSRKNRWVIPMHREVLNYWGAKVIDHINGDELDNRKENLRIITNQENIFYRVGLSKNNTSGYRGVYFLKSGQRKKRWTFEIKYKGKRMHGPYFVSKEEALMVHQAKLYGLTEK